MQLDRKLYDEINEYCKLNNLKTRDFIHKILNEAFLKEKYGDAPFFFNIKDTLIENSVKEDVNILKIEPEITETITNDANKAFDSVTIEDKQNEIIENVEVKIEKEIDQIEETVVSTQKLKKKRKLK